MKAIEQWGIVYNTYESIDGRRFKDIYWCKGKKAYKILLGIFILLLLFCFTNPWFRIIPIDGIWNPILSIVFSIIFFRFFIWVERNTYKSYYSNNNNKYLLKQYRSDYSYVRYLIFKDHLKDMIEEIYFDRIKIFIDFELKQPNLLILLKRNPIIVVILTVLGFFSFNIDSSLLYKMMYFAGFLLIVTVVFLGAFKDRKYKLYELKKFIFWLEQDKL